MVPPMRVGMIRYLNTLPFRCRDWGTDFVFESRSPARLGHDVVAGRLDAAPVSLVEFHALHGQLTWLSPFGIGTGNRALSAILRTGSPELVDGEGIQCTPESHTSVVLARIILEVFMGLKDLHYFSGMATTYLPHVIIGDRAFDPCPVSPNFTMDLGRLWYEYTGRPFVFALWAHRPDWPLHSQEKLKLQLEQNLMNPLSPLELKSACEHYGAPADYFENFIYRLAERELNSIKYFLKELKELGPQRILKERS